MLDGTMPGERHWIVKGSPEKGWEAWPAIFKNAAKELMVDPRKKDQVSGVTISRDAIWKGRIDAGCASSSETDGFIILNNQPFGPAPAFMQEGPCEFGLLQYLRASPQTRCGVRVTRICAVLAPGLWPNVEFEMAG